MKVTNGQLYRAAQEIQPILNKEWHAKTSYWLKRLGKRLGRKAEDIDKVRVELFDRYGKKQKDGSYKLPETGSKADKLVAEYNALMEIEQEVEWERVIIPLDEASKITPRVLIVLEPFLGVEGEEDEDEDEETEEPTDIKEKPEAKDKQSKAGKK